MDQVAKEQEKLIKRLARPYLKLLKRDERRSSQRRKKLKKRVNKELARANDLQIENWTLSWTFTSTQNICTGQVEFCTTSSNAETLKAYRDQALELRDMGVRFLKRLRRLRKSLKLKPMNSSMKNIQAAIELEYQKGIDQSELVPDVSYGPCAAALVTVVP